MLFRAVSAVARAVVSRPTTLKFVLTRCFQIVGAKPIRSGKKIFASYRDFSLVRCTLELAHGPGPGDLGSVCDSFALDRAASYGL